MSKTREELIARALLEVGVLAAGQTPSAEDAQVIDDAISPIMSDLATRDIYTWGDPDIFEDDAFEHLGVILANSRAPTFGSVRDEQTRLICEARLKQLRPLITSGSHQTAEYF
jgi:hypothetical protein